MGADSFHELGSDPSRSDVPGTRPFLTGSRNTCAPAVPTHLPLADLSRSVSQTNVRLDIPLKNTDRNFQPPPLQFLVRDMQFPGRAPLQDASRYSTSRVMYEIPLWLTSFYGIFEVSRRQRASSLDCCWLSRFSDDLTAESSLCNEKSCLETGVLF